MRYREIPARIAFKKGTPRRQRRVIRRIWEWMYFTGRLDDVVDECRQQCQDLIVFGESAVYTASWEEL